jgi:reductive dehalogenase
MLIYYGDPMQLVLKILGAAVLVFFGSTGITSILEKERRAAKISFIAGILLSIPFLMPLLKEVTYPDWLSIGMVSFAGCCLAIFLVPFSGRVRNTDRRPVERIDERDTMFSRQELVPGSKRFDEYYKRRPQHYSPDNKFRRMPGWLNPGSTYYDPVLFPSTRFIFNQVAALYPRVDGEPVQSRIETDPTLFTDTILRMARNLGAHSSGITELADYHVYSFGGRGDRYGKEYSAPHKYAIALTVEMDYHLMRTAPAAPTLVESASQYYRAGKMAVELAEYIRSCGYRARAHIDANYQVVCPLVARDAGLGEIGRMGLLMTPALGPRVRIAVVTTDMPLVPFSVKPDPALIDFCRKCKKCAIVCPGQSVPFGDEKLIDGVMRWQVNSESCYTYWCHAGTDCGRCVIVCPFAHPDNWFHRLVRFGIRNSLIFRILAIHLDDLFYGRKPRPRNSG